MGNPHSQGWHLFIQPTWSSSCPVLGIFTDSGGREATVMNTIPAWITAKGRRRREEGWGQGSGVHLGSDSSKNKAKRCRSTSCDRRETRGAWHPESVQGFVFKEEGVISLGRCCCSERPSTVKTKNWPLDLVRFQSVKTSKEPAQGSGWGQKLPSGGWGGNRKVIKWKCYV